MIRELICDAYGHQYGPWREISNGLRWTLRRRICKRCARTSLERVLSKNA